MPTAMNRQENGEIFRIHFGQPVCHPPVSIVVDFQVTIDTGHGRSIAIAVHRQVLQIRKQKQVSGGGFLHRICQ